MAIVTNNGTKKNTRRRKSTFGKDRRRKHHHYLVSVYYADGEKFGRVYTDKDKATRLAEKACGCWRGHVIKRRSLSGLSIVVVRNLAKVQVSVRFR